MKKPALIMYSSTLLSLSFWPVHAASDSFTWLVATNGKFNALRLLIAIILPLYAFMPKLQTMHVRLAIRAAGLVISSLALYGLYYLSYGGQYGPNMLPLDIASLMEAGILAVLVSLTVPYGTSIQTHTGKRSKRFRFALKRLYPGISK
jgi:hypothetical protein